VPKRVYIALFRGLNVGGSHKSPMADLRAMLEALGFASVLTYIQSGNAVFEAAETDADAIAARIETGFEPRFGFRSDVVVRTLPEWRAAIAACPFPDRTDQPKSVHVGFCRAAPASERLDALAEISSGRDVFAVVGREIYLHTPDGLARSKLGNAIVARNFGTPVTLRNWRTVLKLQELAQR